MKKKNYIILGVALVAALLLIASYLMSSPKDVAKTIDVYVDNAKTDITAMVDEGNNVIVTAEWFASVSDGTYIAASNVIHKGDCGCTTENVDSTHEFIETKNGNVTIAAIDSFGWTVEFNDLANPAELRLTTPVEETVSTEPTDESSTPTVMGTITLSDESVTLSTGKTYSIEATTDKPTDSKLVYVSENPDIATVDENGIVTWKQEGQTNIIVSADDANEVKLLVTCEVSSSTSEAVTLPENSSSSTTEVVPPVENPAIKDGTDETKPTKPTKPDEATSKPSGTGGNSTIEIDGQDGRRFDVGAGIEINDYYESGSSWEQVLADVQVLATPYGLQVMESGMIGNGSSTSAGYIRVSETSDGSWKLYIYAWRSKTSETGMSATMNTTLQVMKYFLGDENGANLWSFWDASKTGQNPNPADYGMTDDGGSGKTGTFTFNDGTIISYNQDATHQTIFTLI